ncbi:MAG: cupin domain-containing protein [Dorea sp.]|nr:cupin domain-containing protein [Dorea sp.]
MIKRKEELRVRNAAGLQGGKGDLIFTDILLPDEALNVGRLFSKLVVPQGSSVGYHTHKGDFEFYYVLSGEATVVDNGEEVTLYPGDMNLCREGDGHSLENRAEEDLVVLAVILYTP